MQTFEFENARYILQEGKTLDTSLVYFPVNRVKNVALYVVIRLGT